MMLIVYKVNHKYFTKFDGDLLEGIN